MKTDTHQADNKADLLRRARKLTGLSATRLGELAGLHRNSISGYERGLTPPPATWERIRKALKVALTERVRAIAGTLKDLR